MSKSIVTGGAGFIGSHLVDELVKRGHEVTVVDDLSAGRKEFVNSGAKFIKLDIKDSKLREVFEQSRFDYLFHMAAQKSVRISCEDPAYDAEINILGSLNLLECAAKYGTKKIVFASTGGAMYGESDVIPTPESEKEAPVSPYGIAKRSVELYLHYYQLEKSLPYVSLRFSNVYGPRQDPDGEAGVVAIFSKKLLKGDIPTINGDGKQTRDYVFVADVVRACLLALEQTPNSIYNIGTEVETDVNALYRNILSSTNLDREEKHGPAMAGEQKRSCLSHELVKKDLGWEPEFPLEKGIKKTVDWFKQHKDE